MKIRIRKNNLPDNRIMKNTYPYAGMVLVMGLVFLSPFFSSIPSYAAFAICLYRLIRYDAKVFAVDYCLLASTFRIFCTTSRMSFLLYIVLAAAVWHLLRSGIRGNRAYIMLIILMNYLVARMDMNVTRFLLCVGHLAMLCVILPKQDSESAAFAAKAFCVGLLITSGYALIFRNTWQLQIYLGAEAEAIWNSGIMRFRGLVADPNFYMTALVIGLVLLAKLKECGRITQGYFVTGAVLMILLGVMTYSKAFIVMLALFAFVYVIWQFYNRKHIQGILLTVGIMVAGMWLLFSENSPISVVLSRFAGSNINDLTTGRTDIYALYLKEIFEDPISALFGKGLADQGLIKDPHNLYIELLYYLGIVGLVLYLAFLGALLGELKKSDIRIHSQNVVEKYAMIVITSVMFLSLHGIFQLIFYADVFPVLMCILIVPPQEVHRESAMGQG